MKSLHDEDDDIAPAIIESGQKRLVEPALDGLSDSFGFSVGGFHRIVDNDDAATPAREWSAHRRGQPIAAFRRSNLPFFVLAGIDMGEGK